MDHVDWFRFKRGFANKQRKAQYSPKRVSDLMTSKSDVLPII